MSDHYAVLGVTPEADVESIRAAHRACARIAHPDLGGDQAQMTRVNEAWRILRDPVSRATYDRSRGIRPRPTVTTGDSVILTFGRYEGWSLEDIARVDDDYLAWLERSPTGLGLRHDIRRVLDTRQRALEGLRSAAAPAPTRRGWAFSRA
jgi:curved DNA-binding protein CbpA